MIIRDLIKVYDKNFSFFNAFKNSFKDSTLIILPCSFILISIIGFYHGYYLETNNPYRVLLMLASIALYIVSIFGIGFIRGKGIVRKYGSNDKFEEHKLNEIDEFIKKKLGLKSVKQYELLDSLLKKEIEIIEDIKKFPFSSIITQLFVAVLITGLLSYSIKELVNGDSKVGLSLFALYLMIIGTIIMFGLLVYSLRDFGKIKKLKHISRIISELSITISKTENGLGKQEKEVNKSNKNKGRAKNKKYKVRKMRTRYENGYMHAKLSNRVQIVKKEDVENLT
ncbi:hypothetical protein [Ectobacillus polymachus]|uniref:hypothetical protein n=1 Tax=Ectobacillus polymachus TaxID=1508806 RepID=UPI003A8A1810